MSYRRQSSRRHRLAAKVMAGAGTLLLGVLAPAGVAFASTTAATTSTAVTAGSLSIGTTTSHTISVPVAGTSTGLLPSGPWSDTTGSGDGWNGTVALSDLTYTGSWKQTAGTTTPLATPTTPPAFTGSADGVSYTVTIDSGGSSTGTDYSWTSTDPTDKAGGSSLGTSNGTVTAIGTRGITIEFASGTTYPVGATYTIDAGTLSPSAVTLDTSAGSVTASGTTTSPDPTLVGNGTTIPGGGVAQYDYGTAVKFVSAATDTGMGTYTVDPGVKVAADPSSWAATYTAGVEYSIVSGP